MTFLISTETLAAAWADAQRIARDLKALATNQKNASLTGTMPGSRIMNFEGECRNAVTRLDAVAALSGIAAYVASLPNTPGGYDVAAAFSAMRTQIVATGLWIRDNFPKDGNGFLLERTYGVNGPVERTFSAASLAAYRTQLDALIATIE